MTYRVKHTSVFLIAKKLSFRFQEIQRLRQQILAEEQHLRAVSSPSYVAKDRDRAVAEQSVSPQRERASER